MAGALVVVAVDCPKRPVVAGAVVVVVCPKSEVVGAAEADAPKREGVLELSTSIRFTDFFFQCASVKT